jgi:hypothetical protein
MCSLSRRRMGSVDYGFALNDAELASTSLEQSCSSVNGANLVRAL